VKLISVQLRANRGGGRNSSTKHTHKILLLLALVAKHTEKTQIPQEKDDVASETLLEPCVQAGFNELPASPVLAGRPMEWTLGGEKMKPLYFVIAASTEALYLFLFLFL
jgi:hypothetical protein